jgi:hypothetical protein
MAELKQELEIQKKEKELYKRDVEIQRNMTMQGSLQKVSKEKELI